MIGDFLGGFGERSLRYEGSMIEDASGASGERSLRCSTNLNGAMIVLFLDDERTISRI